MESSQDTSEELQVGGKGFLSKVPMFFNGQVPEAIAVAQKLKKVLIVYVAGDDEVSNNMNQITWQDSKVHEVLLQNYVVLRLVQGSTDAAHFSALYPCQECPVVTLISHTGLLLNQWGGYIAPADFHISLQQVAAKLQLQSTAAMIAALASDRANWSSSPIVENKSEKSPPKNEGSSSNTAADESSTKLLPEHSVENISASKPSCLEDPSFMHTAVDLPLEPNEPDFVNNRVAPLLDEFVPPSSPTASNNEALLPNTCDEENIKGALPSSNGGRNKGGNLTSILLQIRLTNGEKLQHKFDPNDTLTVVKEFIDSNQTDGNVACALAVLYPRRIFSHEEMRMSLLDLNLEDRATLILVRNSTQETSSKAENIGEASDSRSSNGAFWRLLSYFNPFSSRPGSSRKSMDGSQQVENDGGSNASTGEKASRSWGANIHTLQHEGDNEAFKKGNAFWNGNSTQYGGGGDNPKDQ